MLCKMQRGTQAVHANCLVLQTLLHWGKCSCATLMILSETTILEVINQALIALMHVIKTLRVLNESGLNPF